MLGKEEVAKDQLYVSDFINWLQFIGEKLGEDQVDIRVDGSKFFEVFF